MKPIFVTYVCVEGLSLTKANQYLAEIASTVKIPKGEAYHFIIPIKAGLTRMECIYGGHSTVSNLISESELVS